MSHAVTFLFDSPIRQRQANKPSVEVNIVNPDQSLSNQEISLEYDDLYRGDQKKPPILILLPGGPEGPEAFKEIAPKLSNKVRVIIPYLPGYGIENDHLPSYSFKTSSQYTYQFLEKLQISQAHIFGFGLGGASAIYLAHDHPEKVSSLGLIASIGVQELELLGSHRLNYAVHGVQLAAVWLLHNAVPHFGLFDAIDIDVSYAKRQYESDQRPLRGYLESFTKPMLIIHGEKDPLVPLAAAQEHHRIVPQSYLKLFNADHDLMETDGKAVAESITKFIQNVEQGKATTAATTSQQRIQDARKSFSNVEFAKFKGLSLLIIMLIIMLGMLISEDLTCIGAGLLVARGLIGFIPATAACFLGIFIGDVGLYVAGRFLGRSAIKRAPFKWVISEKDLERSAQWFKVRGPAIIIATRFLPGSRMPTYFSAGVIKAGFWMFLFYFTLSGLIWTPMLVGISKLLGNELLRYFTLYQDYAIWVFSGAIGFIILLVKLIIPAFSYKGRRLLLSRYRRITRWQYWWPLFAYLPLAGFILYLGIKYRSLTLFTAVNPATEDGEVPGYCSGRFLDLLNGSSVVAKNQVIASKQSFREKLSQADEFMMSNNLNYPVVLKPAEGDGQTDRDISIIKNRYALQDYLSDSNDDLIIQEYVQGIDIELTFSRFPNQESINIVALTAKSLPAVTGDAEKTIQELILSDDNAVSRAQLYLKENDDQLFNIPDKGERILLTNIAKRSRGAIYEEAGKYITKEFANTINKITQTATGYYVGELTIKVPSLNDLDKKKDIKVIQAKGLNFGPPSIYDSRNSFIEGQKILFGYWRTVFKIANLVVEKGEKSPTEMRTLLKHIFNK